MRSRLDALLQRQAFSTFPELGFLLSSTAELDLLDHIQIVVYDFLTSC